MIYVSKDQLKQVEYLIHQSIQGNHVLFDPESVRAIFWKDSESTAATPPVESIIENLILEPTIHQKRAFLERLDRNTFESVVRTYFNIVENNLLESTKVLH